MRLMPSALIEPAGTGTLHRRLINGVIIAYGARTAGWRRELTRFVSIWDGYGPGEFDEVRIPQIVPDAFRLDVTREDGIPRAAMTVWEVEVTHPMPPWKLHDYGILWEELDYSDIEITFALRTVDKHGTDRPYDLEAAYVSWLRSQDRTARLAV